MPIFIVVEEEGEYSAREWKIVAILTDKNDALKWAWRATMNQWRCSYHVQHWQINRVSTIFEHVETYFLDSYKLRQELTNDVISRAENDLENGTDIPCILLQYMRTTATCNNLIHTHHE
jgi:hypothetical protein